MSEFRVAGIGSAAATALFGSARASGILEDCVCFSCLILKAPNSLPPLKVIRGAKGLKRSDTGCFSSVSAHTHTSTYDTAGLPFLLSWKTFHLFFFFFLWSKRASMQHWLSYINTRLQLHADPHVLTHTQIYSQINWRTCKKLQFFFLGCLQFLFNWHK